MSGLEKELAGAGRSCTYHRVVPTLDLAAHAVQLSPERVALVEEERECKSGDRHLVLPHLLEGMKLVVKAVERAPRRRFEEGMLGARRGVALEDKAQRKACQHVEGDRALVVAVRW